MLFYRIFRRRIRLMGGLLLILLMAGSTTSQAQERTKQVFQMGVLNPGWYKCEVTCTRLGSRGVRILGQLGDLCAIFEEGLHVGQFVVAKPMKVQFQIRAEADADVEIGKPVRMPVLAQPGLYDARKWDLASLKLFADYAMIRLRAGSKQEEDNHARLIREAGLIPAYRFWVHPAYKRWPMKLRNGKPYDGTRFRPWLEESWEAFSTWVLERTAPRDFVVLDFETYGPDKWDNFTDHPPAQIEACKAAVAKWMPMDRQYVVLPHSWIADLPRATSEALAAAGAQVWFRCVSQRPPPDASAMWYIKQSWHAAVPEGCGFSAHGWLKPENATIWAKNWTNYAAVGGVPMVWCEDPTAWTLAANVFKQSK